MAAKVSHLGMGWADEALELVIEVDDDGMARLVRLAAGAVNDPKPESNAGWP